MSEADVERFLWDLERELSHLDGTERREHVQAAEALLHERATRIAAEDDAEHVSWYHYVQASAEIGPPERLAAELTGEPLPRDKGSNLKLWLGAVGLLALVVGMLAIAWWTTGDLETVGSWSGTEDATTAQRVFTFNVSEDADSVFLSMSVSPTLQNASARVIVLDGAANKVYPPDRPDALATVEQHLEVHTFLQGEPGTWRVLLDLQTFTGAWTLQAQQEVG